jgi:predicted membrane protein
MDREQRREERRQRREEFRMRWEEQRQQYMDNAPRHGHVWTGLFIVLIGVAALLHASFDDLPAWIFSWQMFLIALGLFLGLKHGFRGAAWIILIAVGSFFMIQEFYPDLGIRRYFWPLLLIAGGAFIIIRPRRKSWEQCMRKENKANPGNTTGASQNTGTTASTDNFMGSGETWSKDDFVDSTSIFGGDKKILLSKDFKGGDIVNIFGGTELNLTQADINGKVTIEITTIFGGTKLIVPANWEVKSEAVTIFGGLEDKRSASVMNSGGDKILVLKGTVIFGGIEIKSF